MSDAGIASPCIRACVLDEQDVCLGCLRSMQEVMEWSMASEVRKAEILQLVAQRRIVREGGGY